jgi:hypothetical protein
LSKTSFDPIPSVPLSARELREKSGIIKEEEEEEGVKKSHRPIRFDPAKADNALVDDVLSLLGEAGGGEDEIEKMLRELEGDLVEMRVGTTPSNVVDVVSVDKENEEGRRMMVEVEKEIQSSSEKENEDDSLGLIGETPSTTNVVVEKETLSVELPSGREIQEDDIIDNLADSMDESKEEVLLVVDDRLDVAIQRDETTVDSSGSRESLDEQSTLKVEDLKINEAVIEQEQEPIAGFSTSVLEEEEGWNVITVEEVKESVKLLSADDLIAMESIKEAELLALQGEASNSNVKLGKEVQDTVHDETISSQEVLMESGQEAIDGEDGTTTPMRTISHPLTPPPSTLSSLAIPSSPSSSASPQQPTHSTSPVDLRTTTSSDTDVASLYSSAYDSESSDIYHDASRGSSITGGSPVAIMSSSTFFSPARRLQETLRERMEEEEEEEEGNKTARDGL